MSEITVTVLGSTSGSSLVTGGETVSVLVPTGAAGADAKQVEFQSADSFLQWRRVGETSWSNLVALSSILGPPNVLSIGTVTAGATAAATITGSSPSQTLSLVLPARQPEFQSTGTYLQWRLVGDTAWNNLVEQSALVGPQGLLGPPNVLSIGTVSAGATASATITGSSPSQTLSLVLPASQPEFQSNGTYLQWRLVGDTAWNNLVAQSALVGPQGPSGGVRIGTVLALS